MGCQPPVSLARAPSILEYPLQSRDQGLALQMHPPPTPRLCLRHTSAAPSPSSQQSPQHGGLSGLPQLWPTLGDKGRTPPVGLRRTAKLSPALFSRVQTSGGAQNHECWAPPYCLAFILCSRGGSSQGLQEQECLQCLAGTDWQGRAEGR